MRDDYSVARSSFHHGDLRNALLREGEALVGDGGPEGLSVREAARGAGVSSAAAYKHFDSREALLRALAEVGFERLRLALEEAVAGVRGRRRDIAETTLRAVGRAYLQVALERPGLFRTMFGRWPAPDAVLPVDHGAYEVLQRVLDDLAARGALDARLLEGADLVVWSAAHGLTSLVLDGRVDLGPDREPAWAMDLVMGRVASSLAPRP